MSSPDPATAPPVSPLVVVTGANGLVGSHVCSALVERGARVRAVVRRAGTAPALAGVEEYVGDFTDAEVADAVVRGADAVVTTVHPMAGDLAAQRRDGVEATARFVRAAAAGGVARAVHVSTAAVYDRTPGVGDVGESSALVDDDGGVYPVTKRDLDLALGEIDTITRVLVRPPAILGPSETSVWNALRPATMRDDPDARRVNPEGGFAWVHVDDLAAFCAEAAVGGYDAPVGACTPVNLVGEPATQRDYYATVTGALGVDPVWTEEPAWTGALRADRARDWGWTPQVGLAAALAELRAGIEAGLPA